MMYPIANNYVETLERVRRQLSEMAFTERHPEPMAYEEIQTMIGEVLRLNIMELYREAVNSDSLRLYKSMFSDILTNPHVVNGTTKKRITILPYYPAGTTIVSDSGNNIALSMIDGRLIGTETDAEGKEIAKHEIISYLFDGDRITKRLLDESRNADYILFFLSQTNQLQEAIFERWEDVRVMFDYIEKPNLKKYKRDFDTALLEKEGKEKPKAWKAKPAIISEIVKEEDIIRVTSKMLRPKSSNFTFNMIDVRIHGKSKNLHTYLLTKGNGCLRLSENDWYITLKALEYGLPSLISNGNRLDVLYYVFMVYADRYIHKDSRDEYKERVREQIEGFGKVVKDNLHTEEKEEINRLMQI